MAALERGIALDSSLVTRIAGDRSRLYGFAPLSLRDSAPARALAATGRFDAAVGTYQARLRDSVLGDEAPEPWALADFELAFLYDRPGDSAAALPLYRRLASQWRAGDGRLPVLQAVRRRLDARD